MIAVTVWVVSDLAARASVFRFSMFQFILANALTTQLTAQLHQFTEKLYAIYCDVLPERKRLEYFVSEFFFAKHSRTPVEPAHNFRVEKFADNRAIHVENTQNDRNSLWRAVCRWCTVDDRSVTVKMCDAEPYA